MQNVPSEAQEQKYIFEWIAYNKTQMPELRLCCHIPNGGYRNPREAHNLKLQGVQSGVPDLFLPVARGGFHGLFIELKRKKGGTVSPEQKQWLADLEAEHYRAIVCHGGEEACDELYRYLTDVEQ